MIEYEKLIEIAAEACYNTHWGLQITGRYPPVWVDVREETKEFIRKQMYNVFEAIEEIEEIEGPTSLKTSVC